MGLLYTAENRQGLNEWRTLGIMCRSPSLLDFFLAPRILKGRVPALTLILVLSSCRGGVCDWDWFSQQVGVVG